MGTYLFRIGAPSSVFLVDLGSDRVPVVPLGFAYKPWFDVEMDDKLYTKYVLPTARAWDRTTVTRPAYYVFADSWERGGAVLDGAAVYTLPDDGRVDYLDDADIGTFVGRVRKKKRRDGFVWVVDTQTN